MDPSRSKVQQFLLQSMLPILFSLLLGFVFYQDHIFDRHYGAFQFVWSAVVASLFYYLLLNVRQRDAFLAIILLFFLTLLTTGSTRPAFILRDVFYIAAIAMSMYVYFKYFRAHPVSQYAYPPFVLAGVYSVVYVIASEIHLGIIRGLVMEDTGGTAVSVASATAFFGVAIGFAVGAGIAINERIASLRETD